MSPAGWPHPAADAARVPRVGVCVSTFRRPVGLRRLLESLSRLELDSRRADVFLVVVDNDESAGGRFVVAAAEPALPFPVVYAVEPERNIARSRNRAVALAHERGADWIAFVDDDETVPPGWLAALLGTRERLGADVVLGAVRPVCPPETPEWLAQGPFFGGNEVRTGAPLTVANTGNVLVDARLLRAVPGPFDPRFGVTGGSDSQLFMRLHREGARMVFAHDAVSWEHIPASRAHVGWVLRRAFRVGNTAVRCEWAMPPGTGRPLARTVRALARLGWGTAALPFAALRGRGSALRALWNVSYGAGAVAALAGVRYREYSTVHGG